ncbi:mechanosensitive ion channel [Tetragenococcus halophilus]|uniref:mechanosensitive ion channel n=1 Tax=Tetragenococcus halophilus TaxID=51669 RepID=UPI00209B4660|nr:mechanosensitive ion channel [Tetragenococcus halophilus]MCO8287129.1 mechanosensitive ion channel [Tetragenococcus halophilus]
MDTGITALDNLLASLPAIVAGIVLLIVAWIVASILKNILAKGLKKVGFSRLLTKWGMAKSEENANSAIDSLAKVVYYIVWLIFLPGIFESFGVPAIGRPIQSMLDTGLAYLPNIFGAIIILVIGTIVARFARSVVYNLSVAANIDSYVAKFLGTNTEDQEVEEKKDTLASALGGIVYFLIIIPIALIALETLNINTIAEPISSVLNTILAAIPHIVVAAVLLGVGLVLAKFSGQVVGDLLKGTGINKYSKTIEDNTNMSFDLAKLSGQIVSFVVGLLFFVEALNALQLDILNMVGSAIIAYIPNLIIAAIILVAVFVGGDFVGNAISKATKSGLAGAIFKFALIIFGIFMALEQLDFATAIVQQAFVLILGAAAVAFAIAFGIGGRDFAKRQLDKADQKIDSEKDNSDNE